MHILQCRSDLQEAKTNLWKYLGQLVYLQNLAKVSSFLYTRVCKLYTHTHTNSVDPGTERRQYGAVPYLYREAW